MRFCFSKMHGCGNDYVYVNCFEQEIKEPERVSEIISDRHFGIGSDGLILILPSKTADCRMRMFNADGSEGKMCGNGIRCVAKYVYDFGVVQKDTITVETLSGIKTLRLHAQNGRVDTVEVDMGEAILEPARIPVASKLERFINQPVEVNGETVALTAVSMGSPHAVVYVGDVHALDLPAIGPGFERHPLFPDRVNTEFIRVVDSTHLEMRVWERGSGETLACGTGACAAVVASVLNGYCRQGEPVFVKLLGGELKITYLTDGRVLMEGPATHVFDGEIELNL